MQGKKFISPGAWFSMNYPSDWNEFEDGEGSFLFYNPDEPIHLLVLFAHVHRPSLHQSRARLSPGAAAPRRPC